MKDIIEKISLLDREIEDLKTIIRRINFNIHELREYISRNPRKKRTIGELIQIREAADYLGVTPNTLRNWEKAGKIKSIRNKFNKYRLYRKEDLETLLNEFQ